MLNSGDPVYVPAKSKKERIGRLLQMHANEREEIKEVRAGDIAAAVGLKDVTTGDTLCDPESIITLEKMEFPEPVISVAVEPKTKADQEKMGLALQRLAKEDPSFRVSTDQESGQTIISGMGELHLEIIVDRMRASSRSRRTSASRRSPTARRSAPRSSRKASSCASPAAAASTATCGSSSSRSEEGKGFEFVNGIVGGTVPREYIPAVDKGVKEALEGGVIAGYPVVDVKVTLFDGSYHDVDSSEMAFKIAGSMAFKDGVRKAKPVLLEPIMKVEVVTPEDYMGDVIGDLNRRRGQIQGMEDSRAGKIVTRRSAAGRDVRLRDRRALDEPGPRDVSRWNSRKYARGAGERRRSRDQEGQLTLSIIQAKNAELRGISPWLRKNLNARSRT